MPYTYGDTGPIMVELTEWLAVSPKAFRELESRAPSII